MNANHTKHHIPHLLKIVRAVLNPAPLLTIKSGTGDGKICDEKSVNTTTSPLSVRHKVTAELAEHDMMGSVVAKLATCSYNMSSN